VIEQDALKPRPPWWAIVSFAVAGVGFDWDCAYEWFSKQYAFFSVPVLSRMGGIVLWSAAGTFLMLLVVRRAKLRDATAIFFVVSGEVWFYLTTTWVVHPNRWR
jgi:hypothetical protein